MGPSEAAGGGGRCEIKKQNVTNGYRSFDINARRNMVNVKQYAKKKLKNESALGCCCPLADPPCPRS